MQNLRRLLRSPLLKLSSGEQIGEVQDVVLDINKAFVCGIKLATEADGISFSHLVIGQDAVMVRSSRVILACQELFPQDAVLSTALYDREVYTDTGCNVGILVDMLYNKSTGEITRYEISDSLLSDFLEGRKFMPFPSVQVIGQDRIIVPQSIAGLLVSTPK